MAKKPTDAELLADERRQHEATRALLADMTAQRNAANLRADRAENSLEREKTRATDLARQVADLADQVAAEGERANRAENRAEALQETLTATEGRLANADRLAGEWKQHMLEDMALMKAQRDEARSQARIDAEALQYAVAERDGAMRGRAFYRNEMLALSTDRAADVARQMQNGETQK